MKKPQSKKKQKVNCHTPYCKNDKKHGNYCNKCQSRKVRAKNPIKYAWDMLKKSAKKRSKVFTISLADFTILCNESNYIERKGRFNESLSIDRIKNELGYIKGNLRVVTNKVNRENYVEWYREQKKQGTEIEDDIIVGEEPNF